MAKEYKPDGVKQKEYDTDELKSILQGELADAVDYNDQLSIDRVDNTEYYLGESPPNVSDQQSGYISTDVRDIGSEAVWSLSTAKPGNGIDQVRDSNVRRYLTIRTSNNKHTTTYTDGYILAIGWSATSFSKHTVLEKDIDL